MGSRGAMFINSGRLMHRRIHRTGLITPEYYDGGEMTLKELKELCDKATPGPWEIEKRADQLWSPKTHKYIGTEEADCPTTQFIAAANPQTVLQLIKRLEKMTDAFKLVECNEDSPMFVRSVAKIALQHYGSEIPFQDPG